MFTETEISEFVSLRRDLHQTPELLYDLPRTAAKVASCLRRIGVDDVFEGIGRTGVVAVIEGKTNTSEKMIGLRADMDALPIAETSGKPWASKSEGKMHACGHDGHTAMLLAAAHHLVKTRSFNGTAVLIFQPAEEGGAGGKAMIDDGLFETWPCDEVYGLHNFPGLPVGQFATTPGPIMGSVDEIRIEIKGQGGHAAMPETTIDPIPISAALIQGIQTIVSRNIDPIENAVISVTSIHAGDAFNVIPPTVDMFGTARTLNEDVRAHVEQRLDRLTSGIAGAFGAKASLTYSRLYPVTVNDTNATQRAIQAATSLVGQTAVEPEKKPLLGGEDFAFMLQRKPGAMMLIGNGDTAALHHPNYDFNDDTLPIGAGYWVALVEQQMPLT